MPVEAVADHLERVAKDEGVTISAEAAHAMARQSEGSVRDALSLLDQASVLGAETVDETVVTALIGAGRSDVQYALADAVAVGDAKGVFELVSRLVQEGQDLRHVTNEVLAHFRNLLLVKTAPGQSDLLDVTDDESERLAVQAAKYSAGELGRAIALLIEAQTDMRWTTSPRLSLELALIRRRSPRPTRLPRPSCRGSNASSASPASRGLFDRLRGWRLRAPHRRRASRLGPLRAPRAAPSRLPTPPLRRRRLARLARRVPAARPTRRPRRRR